MLAGLSNEDMPFEKELIQAKILRNIFGHEIVLLPRYMTNTIEKGIGIELQNGSIGDSVVFLPEREKYVEFKICKERYLGELVNDSFPYIDTIFVILRDAKINDASIHKKHLENRYKGWKHNDKEILICDINWKSVWFSNKKEEASSGPSACHFPSARSSRLRAEEFINSTTAPTLYLNELKTVNKNSIIFFPDYYEREQEIYINLPKEEYILLYGGNLDNELAKEEYKMIAKELKRRDLKPLTPYMLTTKDDDGLRWLDLVKYVLEFESISGTKLCDKSADEIARELKVGKIKINQFFDTLKL